MPSIAPTTSRPVTSQPIVPWFWGGLALLFLGSLAIRFWGLSRFNTLVFDEVYYAKFASQFLRGEIIFTGHPPLSTYIIALGIWLGNHLPWGEGAKNGLTGLLLSPFSYRWLNAFTGAWIPLVVAALAYQLMRRRSYALIAGLLMALDGLFLVESRYALNNVYLILFGLLGHLSFLLALRAGAIQRWLWLSAAGLGFGAAAAIKWNGLGFLLGAYGIWVLTWGIRWLQSSAPAASGVVEPKRAELDSPLVNLTQLHLGSIVWALAVVPALTYYLSWVPYMMVEPTNSGFWALQWQTWDYHQRVGGLDAHPYCSLWYTWPLMLRPVAYFYRTTQSLDDPISLVGPPLPFDAGTVIYDVHAMGNPLLWWFSSVAVVVLLGIAVQQLGQGLSRRPFADGNGKRTQASLSPYGWTVLYLLVNWGANFLPWVRVTRCLFLYHYMASLVFAVLGLGLLLDRWLQRSPSEQKIMAIGVMILIAAGFVFWMPLFLGLPLTPEALELRRWLPSWV
ncbi:MAG: phospholipid carrier-dependent glycosyltransferase [Synechococcales cyanobacterium C42_A2020_086]|nr:phospholipid carrier-dependent glycosyltransferase [Synechococcales cyanobacterium C42_A2020_086]